MSIFDPNSSNTFVLFTPTHIVTMILIAFIWVAVLYLNKGKNNQKSDIYFRYSFAVLLVGQYLSWMAWEALTGRFSLALSWPLNLCDISNFLCAILVYVLGVGDHNEIAENWV